MTKTLASLQHTRRSDVYNSVGVSASEINLKIGGVTPSVLQSDTLYGDVRITKLCIGGLSGRSHNSIYLDTTKIWLYDDNAYVVPPKYFQSKDSIFLRQSFANHNLVNIKNVDSLSVANVYADTLNAENGLTVGVSSLTGNDINVGNKTLTISDEFTDDTNDTLFSVPLTKIAGTDTTFSCKINIFAGCGDNTDGQSYTAEYMLGAVIVNGVATITPSAVVEHLVASSGTLTPTVNLSTYDKTTGRLYVIIKLNSSLAVGTLQANITVVGMKGNDQTIVPTQY